MRNYNIIRKTGRPSGGKNVMRTPEEKEALIKEWEASGLGERPFAESKGIARNTLRKWVHKYENGGLNNLENRTGKDAKGNPFAALHTSKHLTEVQRLKLELLKKDVEIERLKKGYMVRGDGPSKEFVLLDMRKKK